MRWWTTAFAVSAVAVNCLLAMTGPASAAIVTAQADSLINGYTPTVNYGSDDLVAGKYDPRTTYNFNRKAYIRFDVTSLPTGGHEYLFGLNVVDSKAGDVNLTRVYEFEVYGLNDGVAGENWLEDEITWNNAPANDEFNLFTSDATSLGKFYITGDGIGTAIRFSSVSNPAMATFIEADTDNQVTFMIARNTAALGDNYVHAFASKESATAGGPTLGSAPEPGSLIVWSLLGALGIIVGWWRRRRGA